MRKLQSRRQSERASNAWNTFCTCNWRIHDHSYLSVAVIAIVTSAVLLSVTKAPVIVTIVAASVAAGAYMIYARLDLGYWDKFAVVAFMVSWAYAFVVSFAFIGIGRLLTRPFFFSKK